VNESLLQTWGRLKTPKEGSYSTETIPRTNVCIFKDHLGSMGLLLSGVRPPHRTPRLENISFTMKEEKHLVQGDRVTKLRDCLEVNLGSGFDPELMLRILEAMQRRSKDAHYSSEMLIEVIHDVLEMFRRPPKLPTKEEVIGAWGEMEVLRMLVSRATSHRDRMRIISGWEANGSGRDIIDLRFQTPLGRIAIEVKTSTSSRSHHINGMGQVTVPENYARGFLASILIREGDSSMGLSSADILAKLERAATGSDDEQDEYLRKLKERVQLRGEECTDDRYFFFTGDPSLRLIDMGDVPMPTVQDNVSEVEWVADVSMADYEAPGEVDTVLASISGEPQP